MRMAVSKAHAGSSKFVDFGRIYISAMGTVLYRLGILFKSD
jgi:hypothetical protein